MAVAERIIDLLAFESRYQLRHVERYPCIRWLAGGRHDWGRRHDCHWVDVADGLGRPTPGASAIWRHPRCYRTADGRRAIAVAGYVDETLFAEDVRIFTDWFGQRGVTVQQVVAHHNPAGCTGYLLIGPSSR